MKARYLILIGLALILVSSLAAGYLLALNKAREVICSQLERRLERRVSIGLLWFGLPPKLKIRDLRVYEKGDAQDVFVKANSVSIGINPWPFLARRKVGIDIRLSGPEVFIERTGWKEVSFADILQSKKDAGPKKTDRPGRAGTVEISSLVITDGRILFLDKEVKENGFQTGIEDVDVAVLSFPFGSESAKRFEVSADIRDVENLRRGELKSSGWIDVKLKDMECDFSIDELDLHHFQPYLSPVLPSIESGRLGFAAEVSSKGNDLLARCRLKVEDLKFSSSAKEASQSPDSIAESPSEKEAPAKEGIVGAILKAVYAEALESLKTADNKLEVDFEVRGEMDAPGKVFAKVGENIMSRTIGSSVKVQIGGKVIGVGKGVFEAGKKGTGAVVDTTGKVGQIAEDAGEQIKQVGKELKETLQGVLK